MITALSEMMERFASRVHRDYQLVPIEIAYCPLDDNQFPKSGKHLAMLASHEVGAVIEVHPDDSLKPGQLRAIGKFNFGSVDCPLPDYYYRWFWENDQYVMEDIG
jgi:hypothetical protein